MSTKPSVLFVCVHNAGRSQMAAAYLESLGRGQIEVVSPQFQSTSVLIFFEKAALATQKPRANDCEPTWPPDLGRNLY